MDLAAKAAGAMPRFACVTQRGPLALAPFLRRYPAGSHANPPLPVGVAGLEQGLAEVGRTLAAVHARPGEFHNATREDVQWLALGCRRPATVSAMLCGALRRAGPGPRVVPVCLDALGAWLHVRSPARGLIPSMMLAAGGRNSV